MLSFQYDGRKYRDEFVIHFSYIFNGKKSDKTKAGKTSGEKWGTYTYKHTYIHMKFADSKVARCTNCRFLGGELFHCRFYII